MRELLFMLLGMLVACVLIAAATYPGKVPEKKHPASVPGRDVRLPEEETPEERRAREWLMLLGYSGEKGGSR